MTELLGIRPGITAIIGSGGKTTLMMLLARQLPGRRIVCTTTKIYRPAHLPVSPGDSAAEIDRLLSRFGCICLGQEVPGGKLSAPALPVEALTELADYVLVEADGSHRLPLKAHMPGEPVIPPQVRQVLLVLGLSGIGRPVAQAAHRPERFAALSGLALSEPVTPEAAAQVLRREALADCILLNQLDCPGAQESAHRLAAALPGPVFAGSLQAEQLLRLK